MKAAISDDRDAKIKLNLFYYFWIPAVLYCGNREKMKSRQIPAIIRSHFDPPSKQNKQDLFATGFNWSTRFSGKQFSEKYNSGFYGTNPDQLEQCVVMSYCMQ